jgi:hypothetical protein
MKLSDLTWMLWFNILIAVAMFSLAVWKITVGEWWWVIIDIALGTFNLWSVYNYLRNEDEYWRRSNES